MVIFPFHAKGIRRPVVKVTGEINIFRVIVPVKTECIIRIDQCKRYSYLLASWNDVEYDREKFYPFLRKTTSPQATFGNNLKWKL